MRRLVGGVLDWLAWRLIYASWRLPRGHDMSCPYEAADWLFELADRLDPRD